MRGCSTTMAGIDLVCAGFGDEAISLSRNVAEVGNLLWLFAVVPGSADEWVAADRKTRLRRFSPRAVREAIEKAGAPLPVDQEIYEELCELGPHVTPSTKPQTHRADEQPKTGGVRYDAEMARSALEYLTLALCAVAAGGARVVPVATEHFDVINKATIASISGLAEAAGNADRSPKLPNEECS